jgi:hypothetical protein
MMQTNRIDAMVNSCGEDLHPQRFDQTAEQLRTVSSASYAEVNILMEQVWIT